MPCARIHRINAAAAVVVLAAATLQGAAAKQEEGKSFRFRSGVELINVTATVTDASGRFVPGSGRRTSSSTKTTSRRTSRISAPSGAGQPRHRARHERQHGRREDRRPRKRRSTGSSSSCSTREDEIFLYRFGDDARAAAGVDDAIAGCCPARSTGFDRTAATAMYDAVAEAIPLAAAAGTRRRRSSSSPTATTRRAGHRSSSLRQLIRESEVLVYAIGIDGESRPPMQAPPRPPCRCRCPSRSPARRTAALGGRPQIQWPPRRGREVGGERSRQRRRRCAT